MFLNDLRFAVRGYLRQPGFTIAALLTLALGIGANVAVFSVFEALMMRPLGYSGESEIAMLNHRDRSTGITKQFLVLGDLVDMKTRLASFERVSSYGSGQATLLEDDGALRVNVLFAGEGLMELLRARPAEGRPLRHEDHLEGAANVALLGHAFWQRHYAGRPMVGHSIRIGGQSFEVIGIAEPGFHFPVSATSDVIVPTSLPVTVPAQRRSGWIMAVGRLRPGIGIDAASTEIARVSNDMEREFPATNHDTEYFLTSLRDAAVGPTRPAIMMLLGAVAVVLLIACANVANLMLVRSLGREREFAISQALGAGRGRLVSRILAECTVLAIAAVAAGLLTAQWGARALVALLPAADELPALQDVGLNARVIGFAVGAGLLAAIIAGTQSMIALGGANLASELVGSRGASLGRGKRRASSALIVAEVALAVVLLMGAGLIFRSLRTLLQVDPGFERAGVAMASVMMPQARYASPEARRAFHLQAEAAVRRLPGVQAVGMAIVVPLTGNNWSVPFERADAPLPPGEKAPDVGWQGASAGYFQALRIPLKAGRLFDATERPGGPPTVIVSEGIQKRFFHDSSAVGRVLKVGNGTVEIVGVVGDIHRASLRDEPHADVYFPSEQGAPGQFTLFVRGTGDAAALARSLPATVRALDASVIVDEPTTMEEVARGDTQITAMLLRLLGMFALIAMGLAAVGLYGVMSHAVRLRTRELGTRVALGATPRSIVRLVMRQGIRLGALGLAIGIGVGLVGVRTLKSVVFGVGLVDPASLAAVVLLMVTTMLLACWIPARRAAAVDPARTLQNE